MQLTRKILIVDDEKFVTDSLESLFLRRGHQTFKAEDGQACLELIKRENPHLVLLDLKLPKLNGIEVLRIIRRDYPQLKTIVLTAYGSECRKIVEAIGCDAFFQKPLLIDELARKAEELLSAKSQVAAAITPVLNSRNLVPQARLLIVSPRKAITDLLREYFGRKDTAGGIYEITFAGIEQLEEIRKLAADIILLDVELIGALGEFGMNLMKLSQSSKEVILFGDPAALWQQPDRETLKRLSESIKEVCVKHNLVSKEATNA
ncbi:MAG: response regulator [Candidatus Omnitrophota bacterium]